MKITETYKENDIGEYKTRIVDYRGSELHHILTDIDNITAKIKEKKRCKSEEDKYLHELAVLYNIEDKAVYHSNILSVFDNCNTFLSFITKKSYMLDDVSKTVAIKYIIAHDSFIAVERYKYINNKYEPEYMLKIMNLLNCLFIGNNLCYYNEYFRLNAKNYSDIKYKLNLINDSISYLEYVSMDRENLKIRYDKEIISNRIAQLFY
jgi:hypothetical protein